MFTRVLSRMRLRVEEPYAKRSPEWHTNRVIFAKATANLRAVKDALATNLALEGATAMLTRFASGTVSGRL